MTTLLVWCTSHIQGKQLPRTINKSYFNLHISISELSHMLLGIKLFKLKIHNSLLLSHIIIQPLQHHDVIKIYISTRPSTILVDRKWVEQCLQCLDFKFCPIDHRAQITIRLIYIFLYVSVGQRVYIYSIELC